MTSHIVSRIARALLGAAVQTMAAAASAAAAEPWAFTPPDDTFDAAAGFDLRPLNEASAGMSGFVKRSADGNDFVLGDGKPARFWALNITTGAEKDEDLAHQARFLAKRGVNLVRIFLDLRPNREIAPAATIMDPNRDQIAKARRAVAAMKKEGIYSMISPLWPIGPMPEFWGIAGQTQQLGALFVDPTYQAAYRSWLKALFGESDGKSGVALAKEPAVAFIELVNEDSLLFWTVDSLAQQNAAPYRALQKGFVDFVTKKYGSVDQALEAWGNETAAGDDAAKGLVGFYQVWQSTSNPGGAKGRRLADQMEFLARTMRDYYVATETFLRDEVGCRQLINAGNWRPADALHEFDLERWTYGGNEVMAVNRYMDGLHLGPNAGWALSPGDHYANLSCTQSPTKLPTCLKQPKGYPMVITESCWNMPDLYQSEGPLMIAAYSALTGVDAYGWFTSAARGWEEPLWPWGKSYKWSAATPMVVGQFPAAALIFRGGHLKAGLAIHEERRPTDLFTEAMPIIAEESGYDPLRDAQLPPASSVKATADPLAFMVGRVEVVYDGDPAKSTVVDLTKYIDQQKQTVTSVTGEERIDWGRGLCAVDAPHAQGIAGFLGKAGAVALHDVSIACANPYATVIVVPLDDQPIAKSKKLLLQVGTTMRASGWAEHADEFAVDESHGKAKGFTIDAIGANPWQVESAEGSVTICNPRLTKAVALDANGMPAGDLAATAAAGAITVPLPAHALYALVTAP